MTQALPPVVAETGSSSHSHQLASDYRFFIGSISDFC